MCNSSGSGEVENNHASGGEMGRVGGFLLGEGEVGGSRWAGSGQGAQQIRGGEGR